MFDKAVVAAIEKFEFVQQLEPNDRYNLYACLKPEQHDAHSMIVSPHEENRSVFILKKGLVKVGVLSDSGEIVLKYIAKGGDILGELAMTVGEDPKSFLIAVEPCHLCVIPADVFKRLMQANTSFFNYVMSMISKRMNKINSRLESLLADDTYKRVLSYLIELAEEFGTQQENGDLLVKNFLTNTDIAQLTYTTRQSVNTAMNQMKRDQVIDFDEQTITIRQSTFIA